jgi:predicted dehydrogenase
MRYGIIGAGGMAMTHASHMLRHAATTLVACAAKEYTPAMQALTATAGVLCFDNATDLLSRSDIDAVFIATPTDTHAPLAIEALHAGKHVFVEKPLARTVAEGRAMLATAQATNRKILCGQVVRYFPEYAQSHDLITSGAIGRVGVARTSRAGAHPPPESWYADTPRSGGVALDLLIHDIDWLLWTFGPVQRIYAKSITARNLSGRDGVLAILRFHSGVIAHVEANWSYPNGFVTTVEVAGSDGIVAHRNTDAPDVNLHAHLHTGAQLAPDALALEDPYYIQFCAFDAWLRGGSTPRSTPQDSLNSLATTLAIVESAQTGSVLTFSPEGTAQ